MVNLLDLMLFRNVMYRSCFDYSSPENLRLVRVTVLLIYGEYEEERDFDVNEGEENDPQYIKMYLPEGITDFKIIN
jgi:hypothetical protein